MSISSNFLSIDVTSTATLPGNDLGQVVHTRLSLSPSSIIWYRLHHWEGSGSKREFWSFSHIAEMSTELRVTESVLSVFGYEN